MLYLSKSINKKRKYSLFKSAPKVSGGDNTGFSPLLHPPLPHWKFLPTNLRFKWPCGFFRRYRTRSRYSGGSSLTFYGNASSNIQYIVSLHYKIQHNNLIVRETNRCYEEQNQRFEQGYINYAGVICGMIL